MPPKTPYRSLKSFYPFYLAEHTNRTCRRLHFIGTGNVLLLSAVAVASQSGWLFPIAIVQAYAFAWVGHFFFEHNKPATFDYPLLSLIADWRMWWEILTGKIRF
ncbi:MAG: Mpo1-like protein [Gammaproteobacteria bacterium]